MSIPPFTPPPPQILTEESYTAFHFLAGLSTGVLSATLLQPADLLKTRLQQSRSTTLLPTVRAILSGPDASGLRGLWRGTLPSVIRTGLGSALYFSTLNRLRGYVAASSSSSTADTFNGGGVGDGSGGGGGGATSSSSSSSSNLPQISKTANLATGALSRAFAGLVLMPVTVIKVRYESNLYTYGSIFGACRAIGGQEGVRGFFAGSGATAVRDAPYAGLYVVVYEESKRVLGSLLLGQRTGVWRRPVELLDGRGGSQSGGMGQEMKEMGGLQSVSINFVSGVFAAGVATAITNPFDAVKTRLQLMPGRYGNMMVAGRRMVREEGWRSLMDGLGLRMGRKALSSALAWTLYEELVRRAERSVGDIL